MMFLIARKVQDRLLFPVRHYKEIPLTIFPNHFRILSIQCRLVPRIVLSVLLQYGKQGIRR